MIIHPALGTIVLVEDKIAKLLESKDLEDEDSSGHPTERALIATEKHRFLRKLSTDLELFYKRIF